MAIFTPQGLKIRLPVEYAFGLMARLYPRVDAFHVLKTTEAIEYVPSLLALVAAVGSFYLEAPAYGTLLAVAAASVVGTFLNSHGVFFRVMIEATRIYSYAAGYGLYLIAAIALAHFTVGVIGGVAFIAGRVIGYVASELIDFSTSKRLKAETGVTLTTSERNFFNAYRLHALKLGASLDIELLPEEREQSSWEQVFEDFSWKYPEVVARFTTT